MAIGNQLKAMRRDHPGCRVATFADLSSGLVLFASSEARLPQERLDALCARARRLLSGPAGDAAATLLGGAVSLAVVEEAEGLLVVVRSETEPDEALICQCAPDIDLAAFTDRAARELAALGAAH